MEKQITDRELQIYVADLERRVIVPACETGLLGAPVMVSINDRLATSPLGRVIGGRFAYNRPMAIEYYGFKRRSTGFMRLAADIYGATGLIVCPLVNFAALRYIHIRDFAPDLIHDFCIMKQRILTLRFGRSVEDLPTTSEPTGSEQVS